MNVFVGELIGTMVLVLLGDGVVGQRGAHQPRGDDRPGLRRRPALGPGARLPGRPVPRRIPRRRSRLVGLSAPLAGDLGPRRQAGRVLHRTGDPPRVGQPDLRARWDGGAVDGRAGHPQHEQRDLQRGGALRRDLAPRLAHALLPIPGKGHSDWPYAWVPIVGPIVGGVIGALVYTLLFTGLTPLGGV
jgi:hypothetical protein